MAIKFSQFITQTSASSLSHIVGYNGADNIQITPADFFTSFATGTTGFIPKWTSSSSLGDSILEVNSALPNDVLMPQYIRHAGDTNTYFGFYSNDTFIAATSGNEVMRITSAGNVGIGTSSPVSKLDVIGGVTAQGTLVATGISQLGSSGVNVYLTSSSAGSVGIGTSSPVTKLHVNGVGYFEGGTSPDFGSGSVNNAGIIIEEGDYIYTKDSVYLRKLIGKSTSDVILIGEAGTSLIDEIRLQPGNNGFTSFYDDSTETARFTDGKLGIGTTSPGAKLQIGSATYAPDGNLVNNLLQIKSLSGFGYLTIGNGDTVNSTAYIGGASGFLVFGSVTDAGVKSEHIRMTNTGSLAIGTTSVTAKLDVFSTTANANGVLRVRQAVASNDPTVLIEHTVTGGNADEDTGLVIKSVGNTAGNQNPLAVYKENGTDRAFKVDGSGNGTFAGNVDVNGNLTVEDEIHLTDGGSTVRGKLLLNSSDRDNVELRAESLGSTMKFFTVGTEALELDASQNATFAGDINISNGTPVLTLTDTSSSATTTITLDGVNTTIDSNGTDGDIIFKGNDDGSEITALRLDMSDAGWAHFNAGITVGTGTSTFAGNVHLDSDSAQLQLGDDDDMQVYHNGSNGFINNGTGNLYLDVTGSDDMVFRYKSNDVAMTIDGGASSIITSVSLRADSSIVLNGDSNIVLDTSVSSGESSGTIIKAGTHMSALVAGNLYYASNSMGSLQWAGTDADTGTKNMIALSLGTDADVDGMLLNGIYHKASHSFTVGLPIYISTTPMSMTNTAPSGSGDYVRVVGYAIDSNHIYFCPDNTWVEIA